MEEVATAKRTRRFDLNTSFIPVSILVIVAPIVVLSVQAFYKVDRSATDIVSLNKAVSGISYDMSKLKTDWARTDAKLEIISELLREVRNNQKKGN